MEDCRKNMYLIKRYRCTPQITNRTWMRIDKHLKRNRAFQRILNVQPSHILILQLKVPVSIDLES
jgi:hypothetical protein